MVLIEDDFKDVLVNKINEILNLDDERWNNLDKKNTYIVCVIIWKIIKLKN
jgi:hypothetical protein